MPGIVALPLPSGHHVGERESYLLRGEISQGLSGRDFSGRAVNQPAVLTRLDGRERLDIVGLNGRKLVVRRSGSLVAAVGGKSARRSGSSLTVLNASGSLARDDGKLGGLFLLPLPFLHDRSLNLAAVLPRGGRFGASLGAPLFGMSAAPTLAFTVLGRRTTAGARVVRFSGTGNAPMKELIVAADGTALGYVIGRAQLTVRCDYDPEHGRVAELEVVLRDRLHLIGKQRRANATVTDYQHYVVTLL